MRAIRASFLLLVSFSVASAADLKVKVIDPQSAAVAGAQVSLFPQGSDTPLKIVTTSAEGAALFTESKPGELSSGPYRIQVLAPGFAPDSEDITAHSDSITISLHLATTSETVVVTATRTPVAAEDSGAAISTLEYGQLEILHPVAADDAVRFLPGAVVNTSGQRGGLSSLFVRGGNSNYNKVIVDGVSVTEPGGAIDLGTLPLTEASRLEFLRGTQSTLYGSDAMTSVVQVWTRTGTTPVPELRFGADAGNYGTENGYASLAGSHGRFDYNLFGNQFNTRGQGPNDNYSNSLEGVNLGFTPNQQLSLRLRVRHDNSATGLPGAWNFNGQNVFNTAGTTYVLTPDLGASAHKNDLIASFELSVKTGSNWIHRFTGYDYQGDYVERSWAHTTIGYEFEDENGSVNDPIPAYFAGGAPRLRLNHP